LIKLLKIFVIFVVFTLSITAQQKNDIIGFWQEDVCNPAPSTNLNTYKFYSNGKFEYHFNGFNINKIVIKFEGFYKIKNDSLFTKIIYRDELISSDIKRGPSELSEWYFVELNKIKKKQTMQKWESVPIKIIKIKDSVDQCNSKLLMIIDNTWKYFKIDDFDN